MVISLGRSRGPGDQFKESYCSVVCSDSHSMEALLLGSIICVHCILMKK